MKEIYKFATRLLSASKSQSPEISKLEAIANEIGAVSLQQDCGSDNLGTTTKPSIAIDSTAQENDRAELSALPGLLMHEILKCIEHIDEVWKLFFRPGRPGNLVSTSLGTHHLVKYPKWMC